MLNRIRPPVLAGLFAISFVFLAYSSNGNVHAQATKQTLPPMADLSINIQHIAARPNWRIIVKNNTIGNHPGITFQVVKISIPTNFGFLFQEEGIAGEYDRENRIWTIYNLQPGNSRRYSAGPPPFLQTPEGPIFEPVRIYAEIIETHPRETPGYQFNNADEHWVMLLRRNGDYNFISGDTGVDIGVSNRLPPANGSTTFTVYAANQAGDEYPELLGRGTYSREQFDVQVKVTLGQGLSLAQSPQAPGGTTFNPNTGIWDIGILDDAGTLYTDGKNGYPALPVMVNLTGESLNELPLEKRCLTAEVVSATPWFEYRPSKRENDVSTVCLGKDPKTLLTQGNIELFKFYPCVGVSAYPCTDQDTLELVAEAHRGKIKLPGITRIDRIGPSRSQQGTTWLQPETIVTQVGGPYQQHLSARTADSNGNPIWSTDHELQLKDSQVLLSSAIWSAAQEDLTVTGPGGGSIPGSFAMRFPSTPSLDVVTSSTSKITGVPFDTGYGIDFVLEFGALGQYILTMDIKATHSTAGQLSDSATYTFHVGPVAELEVRDAGPNPAIDTDQHAYTITAVNNGPDAAPVAIELTPLRIPEPSIANAIPSEGTYRDGVWTIDELQPREVRQASGQSEGPTLTVIAESDVPFRADIAPAREYCVHIKTGGTYNDDLLCNSDELPNGYTEHRVSYYDYRDDNNTARIWPQAGTGQGHPDAPTDLSAWDTPIGNIVRWNSVATVNDFRVTHYELQRIEPDRIQQAKTIQGTSYIDEDFASGLPQYKVRAVNYMGVAGPWSGLPAQEGAPEAQAADPTQSPDPVTGLIARPRDGAVDLEWRAGASAGRPDVWHQLWRADDPTWWDIAPRSVGSSRLGYTVTDLENGTEYIFRVRAVTQSEFGDLVPGVSSGPVLVTPTGPAEQPAPPPGQTPPPGQPSGPNHPPEFDRDTAWADYCVNGGTGSGREVARVAAYDPDGDRLTFYQRKGFDEIADNHFSVSTARSGGTDWGVIRTSRGIPRNLEPDGGFIIIDLEVTDGRGGVDQIGVSLQYDPDGGNCQDTTSSRSTEAGDRGPSVLAAAVRTWAGSVRSWWAEFANRTFNGPTFLSWRDAWFAAHHGAVPPSSR